MRTKVVISASLGMAKMSLLTVRGLTRNGPDFPDLVPPTGPSSASERDAAAVRAVCPIPPVCGVYYYEVEIINRGIKGYESNTWSISFHIDIYLGKYLWGGLFNIS
jgi:hypothetical protein